MAGSKIITRDDAGHFGSMKRDAVVSVNNLVTDAETLRQNDISVVLQSAGLVINGAGTKVAKNGSAFRYMAFPAAGGGPVIVLVAANTAMPALAGTVTNAQFGYFVITGDSAGAFYTYFTGSAATRAAVVWTGMAIPASQAIIGIIEINPTGAGNFVGGTTNLDDAGVVPNAVYLNGLGSPILGPTVQASGLVAAQIADQQSNVVGTPTT